MSLPIENEASAPPPPASQKHQPLAARDEKTTPSLLVSDASQQQQQYAPNDDGNDAAPQRQKWYQWFSPSDTPEERRLVLKLDALILVFVFLAYWAKVLDQSAAATAYVSGMRESLGLYGNELNYLNTSYMVGFVALQIPLTLLVRICPCPGSLHPPQCRAVMDWQTRARERGGRGRRKNKKKKTKKETRERC